MRSLTVALGLFLFACSPSAPGSQNQIGDMSSGGPRGTGIVNLYASTATAGAMVFKFTQVVASFIALPSTTCMTQTISTCQISICPPASASDGGTSSLYSDAGTLGITGGTQPVMVQPKADNSYAFTDTTFALWNGGETLTVTAAGRVVPAFKASVVGPPLSTQLTMPTAPALGAKLNINRSSDYVLRWSGAGSANVMTVLNANAASGLTTFISCTFAGASGTASIPAAALATLPAAPGIISLSTANSQMVSAGPYDVSVGAYGPVAGTNGNAAFYQVNYQ